MGNSDVTSPIVVVLQSAVMVGLQYLTTALETLADPENPESESEGYLLEKGVKETLAGVMAKISSLGKANQVEGGEEEGAATAS